MRTNSLSLALRTNGAFSGLSGITMALLSSKVAAIIGLPESWIIFLIGIGLILFSIGLLGVSRIDHPNKSLISTIILMDLGWVAGSILILLFPPVAFTIAGKIIIGLLALIVGLLAAWQYRAMS